MNIRNYKTYNRNLIPKHLLVNSENSSIVLELVKQIKPLDAVFWQKLLVKRNSWNFFRKAGFKHENVQNEDKLVEADISDPEDDFKINVLADSLKNENLLELTEND